MHIRIHTHVLYKCTYHHVLYSYDTVDVRGLLRIAWGCVCVCVMYIYMYIRFSVMTFVHVLTLKLHVHVDTYMKTYVHVYKFCTVTYKCVNMYIQKCVSL